jgi:hypothetical protein
VVKIISANSITVGVAATRKVPAADYTFTFNSDTKFYYRNGVQGTVTDINSGDTVKVWSLKLVDGTAIKVWDRKLWIGSKTGRVAEVVPAVDLSGGRIPVDGEVYGSLVLYYNSKIAYHAVGTANTTIVRETQATKVNNSIPTVAATWADLHNPVPASATNAAVKGTKITATGLWNDTQKMWYLSRIVIKYNQN